MFFKLEKKRPEFWIGLITLYLLMPIFASDNKFFAILTGLLYSISIVWLVSKFLKENTFDDSTILPYLSNKSYKQKGTLEDIKGLQSLLEQNIKYNGSDSEFLGITLTIAKIYNYLSSKKEAGEYFAKALKIALALNYEDLQNFAEESIKQNNYSNADFAYTSILNFGKVSDNNNIPNLFYQKALVNFEQKQFEIAIKAIYVAINKINSNTLAHPEDIDKYNLLLGNIYLKTSDFNQALVSYRKISEKSKLYKEAQDGISVCKQEQQANNEKIRQASINDKKEQIKTYYKKGVSARNNYCLEDALIYFNKAIALDSQNAKCYYQKGLTYYQKQNPNKAKEELSKAIKIEPENSLYYFTRAEINYFQNYYAIASVDYEKGYQLNKNPKKEIISHMENCLALFLDSGKAQADDYYFYANLLIDKNSDKSYIYSDAITQLDSAIRRKSCKEYYLLRAVARSKYLLCTKNAYALSSNFEKIIKDLNKVMGLMKQSDNFELNALLTIDYAQLLKWATKNKITPKLINDLDGLYQSFLIEVERKKIKEAWAEVNQYENQEHAPVKVAESYFIVANDFLNRKQLDKAKYYINKAIELSSNKKYSKMLGQIEKKESENFNKKLFQAEQYVNKKNLDKAIAIYQELINDKLSSQNIEDSLHTLIHNQRKAEQYYSQGLKSFIDGNIEEAKESIKSALELDKKKSYTILNNDITKYENCLNELNKNNYESAHALINELIEDYPQNSQLILLKKKISESFEKYLYEKSLLNISDGNFDFAINDIEQMLDMDPKNEKYKNLLHIAQNRIVDIKTCNIGAILTLNGFDKEKANQFIKDRESINWYDIESFAKYFNLQPHEAIMVEDRLKFPLKPKIKKGRTVDI